MASNASHYNDWTAEEEAEAVIVLDATEEAFAKISMDGYDEAMPQAARRMNREFIIQLYSWMRVKEHLLKYLLQKTNPVPDFDDYIIFDEAHHKYQVRGLWHRGSCTGFVHSFFEHFDEPAQIARIVNSKRWRTDRRYKYYQKPAAQISQEWETNRVDASFRGTIFHMSCEAFYNGLHHPYFDHRQLLGTEYETFMDFYRDECQNVLVPFRTELKVFDMDYEISGSVDMLFRRASSTNKHDLVMYDWKRSKKIDDVAYDAADFGKGPCQSYSNCNREHYYLQLNVYKFLIEKNTPYKITEMYLGVFHENHAAPSSRTERAQHLGLDAGQLDVPYLKIRVPDRQVQVKAMLELRRHNLIMSGLKTMHDASKDMASKDNVDAFVKEQKHLHRLGTRLLDRYCSSRESGSDGSAEAQALKEKMTELNKQMREEHTAEWHDAVSALFGDSVYLPLRQFTQSMSRDCLRYAPFGGEKLGLC